MHKLALALIALAFSAGAAQAYGYESEILEPITAPIAAINVSVKPELISDDVTTTRVTSGEELIATRDAERLVLQLQDDLRERFAKREILAAEGEDGLIFTAEITVLRSNNPGFTERGFRRQVAPAFSFGRGRAAVEGVLTNAEGEELARFAYEFEELPSNLFNPASPWFTARRVFRTFANRTSKDLAEALSGADG